MLSIAICDDVLLVAQKLKNIVRELMLEEDEVSQIQIFTSGELLLPIVDTVDILFLDIKMPGKDGIAIGTEIRKKNNKCQIIIETGEERRYKEAFQIEAIAFITKPFDKAEIKNALHRAVKKKQAELIGEEKICVYHERNQMLIRQKEIEHILAINGGVELYTDRICFRKDISLDKLQKELNDVIFFRINRSEIVNLQAVTAYNKGQIKINQKQFYVSRRSKKAFEKKYILYDIYMRK